MSRSQRKATLHMHRAKLLARDVIRAGNELWQGDSTSPDHRRIGEEIWERPDVARILENCREHDTAMTALRVTTPCGHAALCQIAKTSPSGYGFRGQKGDLPSSTGSSVNRGDIVPAQIECIDLPDASDSCKIQLSDLPELAAELPLGTATDLLLPLHQGSTVRGFADPALRSGAQLDELASMMLMCGLVKPTVRAVPCGIKLFTVAKNDKVGESRSQRLIWDCRPVSEMCRPPPPTVMGSVGSIVDVELGSLVDVELGSASQGEFFSLACTDLACFFYSLKDVVPGLEQLCVLENVDVDEVCRILGELSEMPAQLAAKPELKSLHLSYVSRYGEDYASRAQAALDAWPPGACDLGCTAPPMGFSWSPFIAQCASSFISHSACPQSLHVVHKGNMTKMEGEAVVTYLDDLAAICRGATENSARVAAEETLGALKKRADELGLRSHKDQIGQEVTELGIKLQAHGGTVIATPEPAKFCLLLQATKFVLGCKYVKKAAFLSVLGHFAWVLQLQRAQYSCLAACYEACITTSGRVQISPEVRRELRLLVQLAPMLRADLGASLCQRAYMCDAGPEGGAVVVTSLTKGERYSADVDLDNYPRKCWRMGPVGTWTRSEHNNITEARTNIWSLHHASRAEAQRAQRTGTKARSLRVVVWTDSLVALGSFMKGRSSSRALNRQCRRQAALVALFGVRPLLRYVRTDQNFADGPSRGLRFPCVHLETVEKARVKAAAQRKVTAPMHAPVSTVAVLSPASLAAFDGGSRRGNSAASCLSPGSAQLSDGEFHIAKSDIGDRLGFDRHWKRPADAPIGTMWRADVEVSRVLAMEREGWSPQCDAVFAELEAQQIWRN